MSGKLFLLTVPIGNVDDITLRARKALDTNEYFAVEDTRVFFDLLKRLGLSGEKKKVVAFHDHSAHSREEEIFKWIDLGHDVGIVSDAGSPVISDPAYPLVKSCWERGVEVETYPGVSAVTTTLELIGLPPIPFHFHGFPPRDEGKVKDFLKRLEVVEGTHLFFESPHRAQKTLQLMCDLYPDNLMGIGRELTKIHQTVHRFYGKDWPEESQSVTYLGEFVLAIHIEKAKEFSPDLVSVAQKVLESKGKSKEVAKLLGLILETEAREIYNQLVRN